MSDRRRLVVGALCLGCLLVAAYGALGQKASRRTSSITSKPRPRREAADNSYCFACHINMKREVLADRHRLAGVGCAKCHGESDKHSSDENNVTPPDVMYAPERINAACAKCHPPAVLAAAAKRRPNAGHKLLLKGGKAGVAASPTCTTCHGTHRLPVRTRRWDKLTGKLIADDGVRMVK